MRHILLAGLIATALLFSPPAHAGGIDLAELVDDADLTYDPQIPTPESVLGFEVSSWHARPDQLVEYLSRLAEVSDRASWSVQGHTHESRPLGLLTLTSPKNLGRLERIRARHLAAARGDGPADPDRPVVVYLGYSIHGNEASGSNAALLVAYHLTAGRSDRLDDLLDHTVVLLDPSLNPDGYGRFTQWVNQNRGVRPVGFPYSREHQEPWPGGRTNHYWFDLNRDWLLVQHPESQARVSTFQSWRPNVLADFHEMGSDSTFFFQPGVPSRGNPLTPEENVRLTGELARFHAAALDRMGRLYYTEETFDDFYYGKGSTYPDAQGSVGVLFEQASVRGHARETHQGRLRFSFAVENQFLTSLSTLEGAAALRGELLDYQAGFAAQALDEASRHPEAVYVFGDGGDRARAYHLLQVLHRHAVVVHELGRPVEAGGLRFEPGSAWAVPVDQPQYRLVRSLFDTSTTFADTTFYDVSTWNLPLAFDLPWGAVARGAAGGLLGSAVSSPRFPRGTPPALAATDGTAYAYVFSWDGYYAPRALARLLDRGGQARVATGALEVPGRDGRPVRLRPGAVVVPVASQDLLPEELYTWADEAALEDGVDVLAVRSGLTAVGLDLGSPSLAPLGAPRVAVVVGPGVSPYDAGAAWHYLDWRLGLETPLLPRDRLEPYVLAGLSHLVMVDGRYDDLGEETRGLLAAWVRSGGVLVTFEGAAVWAGEVLFPDETGAAVDTETGPPAPEETPEAAAPRRRYGDYESERSVERLAGAIFQVEMDSTHPLAYGLSDETVPVFRDHEAVLAPSPNPYENVGLYAAEPLLAGYASPNNRERLAGSAALTAHRIGLGTLIRFADDPDFRAIWYGTQKLFANALFFGPVIRRTEAPEEW
jgi:hypothetical protein